MTDTTTADSAGNQPLGLPLNNQLGPAVPERVMAYLHSYGDSRADDDGRSGLRIGEAILSLRRWAAELQAAERERCAKLCEREAQAWRDVMEPDVAAGVEAVADVLRGGNAAYKRRLT